MKGKMLFACVENAGRRVISEASARKQGLETESAFTTSGQRTKSGNQVAVQVMSEAEIDTSANMPKRQTPGIIDKADIAVTMGCPVEQARLEQMPAKMKKEPGKPDLSLLYQTGCQE